MHIRHFLGDVPNRECIVAKRGQVSTIGSKSYKPAYTTRSRQGLSKQLLQHVCIKCRCETIIMMQSDRVALKVHGQCTEGFRDLDRLHQRCARRSAPKHESCAVA